MKTTSVVPSNGQSKTNCLPCKVTGSATFLLIATYFYYGCKHVKPVYYFGTPSMMFLAVTRLLNYPPFDN